MGLIIKKNGINFVYVPLYMKLKCFLVIVFFCFSFNFQVFSGDKANNEKKLAALGSKIRQVTNEITDLKSQKNSLITELKKLDSLYGNSAILLNNLEQKVVQLNNILQNNREQMLLKEQQISKHKGELENIVKSAYGMGSNEKIILLLNQQDPALSGRMLSYYDYLNKARLKKIFEIEKNYLVLRELEQQRITETAKLEENIAQTKMERLVLQNTKSERSALLAKINRQVVSKKNKLDQFIASEKRLTLLLEALQKTINEFPLEEGVVKSFDKLKGKLPWPVKGKVAKNFGEKRSGSRWDGVLINATEGAEIKVVTRGRVVYADWLRGYGLLTIVDHGKGFMTLYAFNQSLYKTVGEWVEAGSVIATVGRSGGQPNAGLYFGIRKKGKPINPVKWCRKVKQGRTR